MEGTIINPKDPLDQDDASTLLPLSHPARNERVFARNVDWNLFKDFLELVRHGGVGAAARATGRQQPSMSAALKRLEDHLGVKLFKRGAQGITLTPAGRTMAELCDTITGNVRSMPHRIAEAAGVLEGLISICMMSDIIAPPLDDAMLKFHERYPGVQIRLDISTWRSVVDSIACGEADIGIACDSAPREDLCYMAIASETQQLYCPRGSDLFGLNARQPVDLADHVFVLTGEDEPDELANLRRRYGLGRKVGGAADNLHEAKRLIELGFGIGFLPTAVAAPYVKAGVLWPLLPDSLLPTYHVYMITRASLSRGTPAALMVDAITTILRNDL